MFANNCCLFSLFLTFKVRNGYSNGLDSLGMFAFFHLKATFPAVYFVLFVLSSHHHFFKSAHHEQCSLNTTTSSRSLSSKNQSSKHFLSTTTSRSKSTQRKKPSSMLLQSTDLKKQFRGQAAIHSKSKSTRRKKPSSMLFKSTDLKKQSRGKAAIHSKSKSTRKKKKKRTAVPWKSRLTACKSSVGKKVAIGVVIIGILIVCILIYLLISTKVANNLGEYNSPSPLGRYTKYAVSTDSHVCAPTGRKILDAGGNAVDAAIAVLLCMGVTVLPSMGLGGGSSIVLYNAKTKTSTYINARESAPMAASQRMFQSQSQSAMGPLAIAVPGELAGYWYMYSKYGSGRVAWKQLFADAINYSRNGFPAGRHLSFSFRNMENKIKEVPAMLKAYLNPETGDFYGSKDIFKQPALADTLEELANSDKPKELFYGTIAKKLMDDIQRSASKEYKGEVPIIALEDFLRYEVIEQNAFTHQFGSLTMHTGQLPTAGVLLSFILRVMAKFPDLYPAAKVDPEKAILFFHRFLETLKFAFAKRMYLGDDRFDDVRDVMAKLTSDDFIDEVQKKINDTQTYNSSSGFYGTTKQYNGIDHGTAHMSVLDGEGNAVSVTSTLNLGFGSMVLSPSTGILLNSQMDDFNTGHNNLHATHTNTIAPEKRPLSSQSPAIFTDSTGVRLVIGASGGPRIFPLVSYITLRTLWLGDNIKQAIDSSRVHTQLFPDMVIYDYGLPSEIITGLKKRKHNMIPIRVPAVAMAVSRSPDGTIEANSDFRKGGSVDGV